MLMCETVPSAPTSVVPADGLRRPFVSRDRKLEVPLFRLAVERVERETVSGPSSGLLKLFDQSTSAIREFRISVAPLDFSRMCRML
jgi:hypothetical protein